jgi:arylsulfatase A-like enzyme
VEKYRQKLKPGLRHANAQYAAMVESLDAAVGRVLETLEELQLANCTVVVFTSDNGGRITQGTTTNVPLRYGKASAYEGGVRVPLMIRWPGVTTAGSVSDAPVITMDLFPTLLEGCGVTLPAGSESITGSSGRDGLSLLPLLKGTGAIDRAELFWHYPHHQHYQLGGTMPYAAIRSGDFKLIEFYNDEHVELYDLRDDIGEQNDLAAALPEKAAGLRTRLHDWQSAVGAQMPIPNPAHDSTRPEYTPPPIRRKN